MVRRVINTITLGILVISNIFTPVSYAMEGVSDYKENNNSIIEENVGNTIDNSGADNLRGGNTNV